MSSNVFRVVILAVILFLGGIYHTGAQGWDSYLARYEAGLGSVLVNMDLVAMAPNRALPYLVITGVNSLTCTSDGFPTHKEYKKLYRISNEINRLIFASGTRTDSITHLPLQETSLLVGTFTHQCQRLDYVYVADTVGLRAALQQAYARKYKRYVYHIQIIKDPEWDGYRTFLYPNEAVRIFMMNNRAITRMNDAGDALSRPRFVEHRIYFDTSEDREYFIRYIGRINYDIKDTREVSRDSLRYQLLLARFGTVSLEEMNKQTTYLRAKAREFNGVYDGWQTKLIGTKQRFHLLYNPIAEPTNTSK